MGLTREEQETIIRFDESSKEVEIYTASPRMWTRFEKAPNIYRFKGQETMKGEVISKTFTAEQRFITFRMSDTRKKELTPEEKEKARERVKVAQAARAKKGR